VRGHADGHGIPVGNRRCRPRALEELHDAHGTPYQAYIYPFGWVASYRAPPWPRLQRD
jgi:hypothetical protein